MQLGRVILGQYEVVDLLPSGGEADIAKARDAMTGQVVVLKCLSASPDDPGYLERLSRFQRAGRTCIGHPNVVDPIADGEEDGEYYIVFPYMDGETLDVYAGRHGGILPPEAAVAIVRGVAEGLAAAHSQGVVHRDIKPENILVIADGQPRLIDFGIHRRMDEKTMVRGDGLLGTLKWMSPEQIREPGSEDHRTDLYALGAVFYNALTGAMPIRGTDASSIALSICEYLPPSPRQLQPSVPTLIDKACMRLLVKDRDRRTQSAEEFIRALNPVESATPGRTCSSCGNSLDSGFAFCPRCGAETNAPGRTAQ
jgi:serine/threonine protein kinase